jgi:hypothetical protein
VSEVQKLIFYIMSAAGLVGQLAVLKMLVKGWVEGGV